MLARKRKFYREAIINLGQELKTLESGLQEEKYLRRAWDIQHCRDTIKKYEHRLKNLSLVADPLLGGTYGCNCDYCHPRRHNHFMVRPLLPGED